ncbi:MAG: hypothetical protein QXR06_05040 [Candidatus Bathyarchaeia archaeon]|nr:hypothetical protein [Candidatus Bathyarchaeota archaeon]
MAENEETRDKTRRILESLQKEGNFGFVPAIVVHELYKFKMENFGRDVSQMSSRLGL